VPTNCVCPASSGWASGFSGSLFSPCIGRLDLGSGPTKRADHVQSYRTILCGFCLSSGQGRGESAASADRYRDRRTPGAGRVYWMSSEGRGRRVGGRSSDGTSNENAIRKNARPRRRPHETEDGKKSPSPRRHESFTRALDPRTAGADLESCKWFVNPFLKRKRNLFLSRGPPVSPRRLPGGGGASPPVRNRPPRHGK
jgi:hypothetical protein